MFFGDKATENVVTSPGCSRALPLPCCVALDKALHLSELSFLIFKMGRTNSSQFKACWVDSKRIYIMCLMGVWCRAKLSINAGDCGYLMSPPLYPGQESV